MLSNQKSYEAWLKLSKICKSFASLEPEKQDLAVMLPLKSETKDVLLQLSTSTITHKDLVNKIIEYLNRLYQNDKQTGKYNAL